MAQNKRATAQAALREFLEGFNNLKERQAAAAMVNTDEGMAYVMRWSRQYEMVGAFGRLYRNGGKVPEDGAGATRPVRVVPVAAQLVDEPGGGTPTMGTPSSRGRGRAPSKVVIGGIIAVVVLLLVVIGFAVTRGGDATPAAATTGAGQATAVAPTDPAATEEAPAAASSAGFIFSLELTGPRATEFEVGNSGRFAVNYVGDDRVNLNVGGNLTEVGVGPIKVNDVVVGDVVAGSGTVWVKFNGSLGVRMFVPAGGDEYKLVLGKADQSVERLFHLRRWDNGAFEVRWMPMNGDPEKVSGQFAPGSQTIDFSLNGVPVLQTQADAGDGKAVVVLAAAQ